MAALPLLHLEMHVFPLGRNITSFLAREPHFSSAAPDGGVHPAKSIYAQKSWDIRASDNSGSVRTHMCLAICVFHSNRHDNAFS